MKQKMPKLKFAIPKVKGPKSEKPKLPKPNLDILKRFKFNFSLGSNMTIKMRLMVLMGISVAALVILSLAFFFVTTTLKYHANTSNAKAEDAQLVTKTSYATEELYQLVADTIINRNIELAKTEWKTMKDEKFAEMDNLMKLAGKDKQKQEWVADGKKALEEFAAIYENEILTEMKKPVPDSNSVMYSDSKLDMLSKQILKDMQNLEKTFKAEQQAAKSKFASTQAVALIINLLFCIVLSVLIIFSCLYIINGITSSIKYANTELKKVADGDLSIKFEDKYLKKGDEIGQLIQSISFAVTNLNQLISTVNEEAVKTHQSVEEINNVISVLNAEVQDISATTEQLSASMEETAASTQEMSSNAAEIDTAVSSISDKAQEGAETAGTISKRANTAIENTLKSQTEIKEIYRNTHVKMNESIEKVKSIQQINMLSESILGISEQTNLLALNAAIEAARAGDAGRGFAVVADEIRKLAEESKQAVNKIQQTSKVIVSSVKDLSGSSVDLLTFIDSKILKDYEALVEVCRQYSKDASFYNDMSSDLSATTQELTATVETTTRAITEISNAANEAAEGVQSIAEKNVVITEKASDIRNQTESLKKGVENLVEKVSQFKI